MSYGIFEAAVSSESEVRLQRQAALDSLGAAVYDVREKLGPSLFAARDVEEFRDRVAMMKNDQSVYKIIAEHLVPATGVVRRIVGRNGILETEFRVHRAACECQQAGREAPEVPGYTSPGAKLLQQHTHQHPESVLWSPEQGWKDTQEHRADRRTAELEGTVDNHSTFSPSEGELEPEGDFKGYLSDVGQGAEDKVDGLFTTSGPVTEHTEDPAKQNFAAVSGPLYRDWCAAHNLSPVRLSSLDAYAANLTDPQYFELAAAIQAWESEHHPKTPKGQPKKKLQDVTAAKASEWAFDHKPKTPKGQRKDKLKDVTAGSRDPLKAYISWADAHRLKRISARNVEYYSRGNPQLCAHLARRMKRAIATARARTANPAAGDDSVGGAGGGTPFGPNSSGRGAFHPAEPNKSTPVGPGSSGLPHLEVPEFGGDFNPSHATAARRTAAPDYLQKADDALTQLLTQKAEEFQETIQPLQQALQTVQQAEQIQQTQQGMNVLPPAGTVDVMPGGGGGGAGAPPSTADQVGMPDPNAPDMSSLVQMLQPGGGAAAGLPQPGGAPGEAPLGGNEQPGGPPPAAAQGGLPPDLLQQQPPRAARRGGQGKDRAALRPRQAASVFDLWDKWRSGPDDSRGGEADYDAFSQKFRVGPKALQKLKNQHFNYRPENQGAPSAPKIPTVARRRQSCWPGCHEDEAHAKKFHNKDKQGVRKQAWSGWGPAVFPKARQVTGWNWDEHLSGYLANRPERFSCHCGAVFSTPTGFRTCSCGRQWNSYVIGTGGNNREASAEKYLVREIPLRPDVIVASKRDAGFLDRHKVENFLLGPPGERGIQHHPDYHYGEDDEPDPNYRPHDFDPTHDKRGAVQLVDPRTGTIHNLLDLGEVGQGEEDGLPTFSQVPSDWHRRDENQRWTKEGLPV